MDDLVTSMANLEAWCRKIFPWITDDREIAMTVLGMINTLAPEDYCRDDGVWVKNVELRTTRELARKEELGIIADLERRAYGKATQ